VGFRGTVRIPIRPRPGLPCPGTGEDGGPLRDDGRRGERWKERLAGARRLAHRIDRLTWEEGKVTGEENHRWLVACSDFDGDPDDYARRAPRSSPRHLRGPRGTTSSDRLRRRAPDRHRAAQLLRGSGRTDRSERGAAAVRDAGNHGLARRTVPGLHLPLLLLRAAGGHPGGGGPSEVRGIVHYVQSFCFRQIEDIILREEVGCRSLRWRATLPARWTAGRGSVFRRSSKCFRGVSYHAPFLDIRA